MLAKHFKEVVATDFIEEYVEKNRELHASKYPNMTYCVLDATKLDCPSESFGLVFFSWLTMYMSEQELKEFTNAVLRLLYRY